MSDLFVAMPPATKDNCVIFGKNSNRPAIEVQEVVYYPAVDHAPGTILKCTWLEVDQIEHTYSVILSKPAWVWGAEMGSNEHSVCVGCTPVWTKMCSEEADNSQPKLLGIDFVRLALERAKTSREAVEVITTLLEKYGQGGVCYENPDFQDWKHNNSFLLVDRNEAWVLDTAGQYWAAKKVTEGVCNLSSQLRVGENPDLKTDGLEDKTEKLGFWSTDKGDFDFSSAYSADFPGLVEKNIQPPMKRYEKGKILMEENANGSFTLENMFKILREEECLNMTGQLMTTSSQVSVLQPKNSPIPNTHWFTATPNTSLSVFKPFIFCPGADIGKATISKNCSEDRRHTLYKYHEKYRQQIEDGIISAKQLLEKMHKLEAVCVEHTNAFLVNFDDTKQNEIQDIFKDIADSEVKFYR